MKDYVRMMLLKDILEKMSDEEKRNYVQMLTRQQEHQELMNALQRQSMQIDQIAKKQNWTTDFLSDVGANFFTDGILWLGSRLLKKL